MASTLAGYTPLPEPIAEHRLWQLRKADRTAQAVVRSYDHGDDVRVLVDGLLLTSHLFRPGEQGVVAFASGLKASFVLKGWTATG